MKGYSFAMLPDVWASRYIEMSLNCVHPTLAISVLDDRKGRPRTARFATLESSGDRDERRDDEAKEQKGIVNASGCG